MEWIVAIISVIGAFVTAWFVANHEKNKLLEELKLEYSIESAIHALLSNPKYQKRSLKKIKHHLRGFENDDALRMALIRSGAVAFSGKDEKELWGLLDLNKGDLK